MSHFESILESTEFSRVHRSFIIQLNQITRIEPYEKYAYTALFKSVTKVRLSRAGCRKLKEILGV